VSFSKFHYNDLLPTGCGLVSDTANRLRMPRGFAVSLLANKSATSWQQVRNFPVYGKLRGNVSSGFWALVNYKTDVSQSANNICQQQQKRQQHQQQQHRRTQSNIRQRTTTTAKDLPQFS